MYRHVRFAQRNNDYAISEMIEALLYPLILGLGRIETTEPLRSNGVFHSLAGLPDYPDATPLRRFLERFARGGQNSLTKLHDTWRAACAATAFCVPAGCTRRARRSGRARRRPG